jgi:hypothetical protein
MFMRQKMRLQWWHAIMQKRKTKFFKVLIIGVGWSWSVTELLMRNVARSHQWKSSTNLFTLCFLSIDSFLVTSIVTSFYLFLYFKQLKRETNSFFSATSIYSNDMQKKYPDLLKKLLTMMSCLQLIQSSSKFHLKKHKCCH